MNMTMKLLSASASAPASACASAPPLAPSGPGCDLAPPVGRLHCPDIASARARPVVSTLSALQVSVCFFGKPLDLVALDVLKALHRTDVVHVRLLTHPHELAGLHRWQPGLYQQVVIFDGLHSPGCDVPLWLRELGRHPDIERMVMVRSSEEARQATEAGADHALRWPIDLLLLRAVLWGLNAEFKQRMSVADATVARV